MAVSQEFRSTGAEKAAADYAKIAKEAERLRQENAQLYATTRSQAEQLELLMGKRLEALSAEIRRTQDLKRARQELIATTNWSHSRREASDGRGMVPTTNWSYGSPPPSLRLGYRGDNVRDLVPARHPYFTMRDADVPRLGYRGDPSSLATVNAPSPRLQMANPFGGFLQRQSAVAAQMLAGLVGVDLLLRTFQHQLEQTLERQRGAAEAHKSLAAGQAEILLNTFGESPEKQQQRMARAEAISRETGLPAGLVNKTIGRQAGRGMNLTDQQVDEAARMAARIARHNPEQYEPLAGGIQQTMRIGKTDSRTAASLFMSGAANTYIGDPTLQARFLTQAISGGVASVPGANLDTLEQTMELAAWISQEVGEERGEAGRTSIIAALAEMDQFGRGEGPWARTSPYTGRKTSRPVKGYPTQPKDRIEFLQQHSAERKRFMEHFSERRLFEATYQRLFESGSQQDRDWKEMQGRVKPDKAALDQLLSGMEGGTPQLKTANEAQKTAAKAELGDAYMTPDALRNEARDIRNKGLLQSSRYRNSALGEMLDFLGRGIADVTDTDDIELRALQDLQKRRNGMLRAYEGRDPEARTVGKSLDEQILRLEKIHQELQRMNEGDARRAPSAGPAMNGQRGAQSER